MTSSAFRLERASASTAPRPRLVAPAKCVLALVEVGAQVVVTALELENDLKEWLRAVGIAEGERLTVLRRAAFGGPIHVRTGAGGEFALNRALARQVHLRRAGEDGVP